MPPDGVSMLKVKGLTKSFSEKLILDDISIEIESGKLTTLLGENGAGKSSFEPYVRLRNS